MVALLDINQRHRGKNYGVIQANTKGVGVRKLQHCKSVVINNDNDQWHHFKWTTTENDVLTHKLWSCGSSWVATNNRLKLKYKNNQNKIELCNPWHPHLLCPHNISDLNTLTSCQTRPARDSSKRNWRGHHWKPNLYHSKCLNIISHSGDKDKAQPLLQLSSMQRDCEAVGLR